MSYVKTHLVALKDQLQNREICEANILTYLIMTYVVCSVCLSQSRKISTNNFKIIFSVQVKTEFFEVLIYNTANSPEIGKNIKESKALEIRSINVILPLKFLCTRKKTFSKLGHIWNTFKRFI